MSTSTAITGVDGAPDLAGVEAAFLDAWPALESRWDGSWVWRFARGFTKRANSIQCLDLRDDTEAGARLTRLAVWSRDAGIAPMFRQTPLAGPGIVAALDAGGWAPFEKSRTLYLQTLAGDCEVTHRSESASVADEGWFGASCALQGYDAERRRAFAEVIARMPETATGVTVFDASGAPAASVLAVVVGDLAMFTNVVTAGAVRRQGFGRAAMAAALNAATKAGARRAALHVLCGNRPAEALYAGLGFREIGTYLYRKAPTP